MAGRAGRRGMDQEGHVAMRMDPDDWEEMRPQLEKYRKNAYEPVRSSFNLSWNSVVNLLERHDETRIREILSKSFLSWHLQREAEAHIERAELLEKAASGSSHEIAKRNAKEARRLRKRADTADDRVWNLFASKVEFLRDAGYLAEDNGFNAGAKVLKHLHVSEIPMTELILSGSLERLDPATLFGVLCAVTSELPRAASRNYWLKREDKKLAADLEEIVRGGTVVGAAELTGSPWTWEPDLIPLGRLWAEGHSLQELLLMLESGTDVSGDLITGFRRAKDLAGQLLDVYAEIPDRYAAVKELIRKVSRDEVEVVD
jgi:superfamily II RNA helicase